MKALATLIRVAKSELDEKRQLLAQRETVLDQLTRQRHDLVEQDKKEKELARQDTDAGMAYAAWLNKLRRQLEALDRQIAEQEKTVAAARDIVAEAFAELKKYEITKESRERQEAAEAGRREQEALDEMGIEAFRRQSANRY